MAIINKNKHTNRCSDKLVLFIWLTPYSLRFTLHRSMYIDIILYLYCYLYLIFTVSVHIHTHTQLFPNYLQSILFYWHVCFLTDPCEPGSTVVVVEATEVSCCMDLPTVLPLSIVRLTPGPEGSGQARWKRGEKQMKYMETKLWLGSQLAYSLIANIFKTIIKYTM